MEFSPWDSHRRPAPFLKILFSPTGLSGLPAANPLRKPKPSSLLSPSSAAPFFPPLPAPEPLRQATTTSFSTSTASPSAAGTIGERTTPPSAKPMWRKIDPMKNRMLQSKPWIALPLFLGALSFLSFALYFYSANHAPYSYTDCILAGPVFSLIGMIFSFLTRKSRKAYPNLWICGLIACSLGFILCALILAILIFFLAATVTGGL